MFQPVSRLSSWLWLNSAPLSSKTCSQEHTTALATTIKWWKQPRYPSTGGGSIIWVRAGQDQSTAEVRAGQGSEQGRIRAGLGSEQDRGDRVLSPGCSGKSMGQARGRNSRAGAGQASNPRRAGVWLQLPLQGAPLPERRECGPLPPAPAPACCREMTEPRDHTGRGTVTQGCRQALSRATLPWAGGGRERETPGQADAFCSRGPKEAASRLTLQASVPSSFLVTTWPRNSGQLDVHLPPNSSS